MIYESKYNQKNQNIKIMAKKTIIDEKIISQEFKNWHRHKVNELAQLDRMGQLSYENVDLFHKLGDDVIKLGRKQVRYNYLFN